MIGYRWIEDDGNLLYMYGDNDEGCVSVRKTVKGYRSEAGNCKTAKYFPTLASAKKAVAYAVENGKWPVPGSKKILKNPSIFNRYFVVTYTGVVEPFETKKQAKDWTVDAGLNSDDFFIFSKVKLSYLRDNINAEI